jgi:hypothetical protein
MKLIKHMPIMKRILLGALSLLALGLLAACGGYNQTTTQAQNALSPNTTSQTASLPLGMINNQPQASYPDPTNQSALPASVKVTDKGETVLLRAPVTEGYQIYECQASSTAKSGFAWTLQAPFAFLKADAGTNVIHSTGPAWLYTQDGSEIIAALGKFTSAKGSVVPASATPDAKSVAWLRLNVTQHLGKSGLFSNVEQVQRLFTHGGIAPSSGCNQDAANHHVIQPVSYTAEYVFWGRKG